MLKRFPTEGFWMLDLKAVVADFDSFERRLGRRGPAAAAALHPVKELAARRRELNLALEQLKKQQSQLNAKVGQLMRTDKSAGEKARAEARAAGESLKQQEEELRSVEAEIDKLLL